MKKKLSHIFPIKNSQCYILKYLIISQLFIPISSFSTSIVISGSTPNLTISSATPGSDLDSVQDNQSTYTTTTLLSNAKITGKINSNMPSNTSLSVQLATGAGTSAGTVALTTADQDLVTGIPIGVHTPSSITYTLSATIDAGPLSTTSKTVTYTLIDNG